MNARSVIEAETPKGVFKRFPSTHIWNGSNYFVNLAKPDETWEETEFCPVSVFDNKVTQLDGMYGLHGDVIDHFRQLAGRDEDDERDWREMRSYTAQWETAIGAGRTSGIATGAAGPRRWRLVYWPHQNQAVPLKIKPVQVEPGVAYGETEPRDD